MSSSPSFRIVSPASYFSRTSASAMALRSSGMSELKSSISERVRSYMSRFRMVLTTMMFRKVMRSTPQSTPAVLALTVAARGQLYMRASSPNEPFPS